MKYLLTTAFIVFAPAVYADELIGHASQNESSINKEILPVDKPYDTDATLTSAGSKSIDDGTSRIENTDKFDEHKDIQDRPSIEKTISRNPAAMIGN